jgi:hypothetical protein
MATSNWNLEKPLFFYARKIRISQRATLEFAAHSIRETLRSYLDRLSHSPRILRIPVRNGGGYDTALGIWTQGDYRGIHGRASKNV